jgi:hypothetical protein
MTRPRSPQGWMRVLCAVAGPCLIVLVVLTTLHDMAFFGMLPGQNKDIEAFFLPNHCFLGRSIAAGRIPGWNPHVMGGAPFAGDPQSGWMSLVPMALYSTLDCDVAVRWHLILHHLLAGLGTYLFLRAQRASRPAATVSGLALVMMMAASKVAANVPFSGVLAWTPVLLTAGTYYFRNSTGWGRPLWAVAAALAWGQVAASHLSHGLVVATGALVALWAGMSATEIRAGQVNFRRAALRGGLLVAALPLVNLASLAPRLAYIPETNLALGYDGMNEISARIAGTEAAPFEVVLATQPSWPFVLTTSPGAYAGALVLALAPAALLSRRRKAVAVSVAVYGAIFYVAGLEPVVERVAPLLKAIPLSDFYPHRPERFRYAVLLAIAVLAGLGLDAWMAERSLRRRLAMVSGIGLWGIGALAVGARPSAMTLFAVGTLAGAAALFALARRTQLAPVLALVLAVELVAGAFLGQARQRQFVANGISEEGPDPLAPLLEPDLSASTLTTRGRNSDLIEAERPVRTVEIDQRLRVTSRAMIWGTESAQGFNPAQPRRYWTFVRAVNGSRNDEVLYNQSRFLEPVDSGALDLLQVGWALAESANELPDASPTRRGHKRVLLHRTDVPRRAAVYSSWKVAASPGEALEAVTTDSFGDSRAAVLEGDPGSLPKAPARRPVPARYVWLDPQTARIELSAPRRGVLLIRNTYDDGWSASVDGRPEPVLRGNYLLQAIVVPKGDHVVRLSYADPWVSQGALGSALSLGGLVLLAVGLAWRGTRSAGAPPHGPVKT